MLDLDNLKPEDVERAVDFQNGAIVTLKMNGVTNADEIIGGDQLRQLLTERMESRKDAK